MQCPHNASDFIGSIGCSVRRDLDNITKTSMFIYLIKKVDDFDVRYVLEMSRNKLARVKMLDLKTNGCNFLKAAQNQKLLKIFKNQLERTLNEIPKCPLKSVSFSI